MDNYNHELHDMKTSWSQNYIMLRGIAVSEMRTIKRRVLTFPEYNLYY